MIISSRQNWTVGSTVKVGFLTLRVTGVRAEYDYKPDIYSLESLDGSKRYEFIPHNGLTRIEEAPPVFVDTRVGVDRYLGR